VLRIADNKIGLNAGWDIDLLKLELSELSRLDLDFDLTTTGFEVGEIDLMLNAPADPDDEQISAAPANPRTEPGDIWACGLHRIGCGDVRDAAFLKRVIGSEERIGAAFLDPPYNVRINGHANARGRHREFAMASDEQRGIPDLSPGVARRLRRGLW
jgi:hypothetical protein